MDGVVASTFGTHAFGDACEESGVRFVNLSERCIGEVGNGHVVGPFW